MKQQIKGTAWMSLAVYSKTQEETEKLKKELLSRKAQPEDLESSQVVNLAENEKVCSGGNIKGVAGYSLHEGGPHSSRQSGTHTDGVIPGETQPTWTTTRKKAKLETGGQTSGILQMGQQNYLAVNKIREE